MFRRESKVKHAGGTWTLSQGSVNGSPVLVRFDRAIGSDRARRRSSPFRIGIALPFSELLSSTDHDRLADFEDATAERLGTRGAQLVAVITQSSFREFLFYAPAADWVADEHRRLQDEFAFDVQMYAAHDPGWTAYKAIIDG